MTAPDRVVLLVTSPRLPAGLLTAPAWDLVRSAPVYTAADGPQPAALRAAGVTVTVLAGTPAEQADTLLAAGPGTVVHLAGPDGDEELARRLGTRLVGAGGGTELELEYGSWDPPGARLLDAVAVMDRLRVECPWDREQTHASLAPYLLEETYEAYDAILGGKPDEIAEELGDVLFQVVFHARVAADADTFTVDDVAAGLVGKLVRRHPHVFGEVTVSGADEVHANWEEIKRAEKGRRSAVDGVALSAPALALAAKLIDRASRAGVAAPVDPAPAPVAAALAAACADEDTLGTSLLAVVAAAREHGLDPEAALRAAALRHAGRIRAGEPGDTRG